jgi:hypothetical protein
MCPHSRTARFTDSRATDWADHSLADFEFTIIHRSPPTLYAFHFANAIYIAKRKRCQRLWPMNQIGKE